MSKYQLTISTLSPLHIGNGEELRYGFDFIMDDRATYRLNEDAILEVKSEKMKPDQHGRYPLLAELLNREDRTNKSFFRYKLALTLRSTRADARLQASIKDVHDRPYLPGSSIKGALRTALAWSVFAEVKPEYLFQKGLKPKMADRIEDGLFRPNESDKGANFDLLRALKVSDCSPVERYSPDWMVVNAQVINKKNDEPHNSNNKAETQLIPIGLEAIPFKRTFQGTLSVEDFLFSAEAEKKLHLSQRRHWLEKEEFISRIRLYAQARIKQLKQWFENVPECGGVLQCCQGLEERMQTLQPNQAILQMAWGSGWDGVTFWNHLTAEDAIFTAAVGEFRQQELYKQEAQFLKLREKFPASRRVVLEKTATGARDDGISFLPATLLGWVQIELSPL